MTDTEDNEMRMGLEIRVGKEGQNQLLGFNHVMF
jgi:hypothetical protein